MSAMGAGMDRAAMAERLARDIPEGWYVNLGIGIPTLVVDFVPADREVFFHSENGILGLAPLDEGAPRNPWIVNAGKMPVSLRKGASIFSHAESFAMIRGGHIDLCVLGAFEVSDKGDLANWSLSASDAAPAVGGAMDLAAGAKRIWVIMEHVTKDGRSRLVRKCRYPLTARHVVSRVFTNLGVFDVVPEGFKVLEIAPGVSLDEIRAQTEASLI